MSHPITVISQWRAKPNCETELLNVLRNILEPIRENLNTQESVRLTTIASDPRSPAPSKYQMALIFKFSSRASFDTHCQRALIVDWIAKYIDDQDTALVESWCSRIFTDVA